MDCNEARRLITDELDGATPAGGADALPRHLAGCAACRAYRAALEEEIASWRERLGRAVSMKPPKRRVGGNAPYHGAGHGDEASCLVAADGGFIETALPRRVGGNAPYHGTGHGDEASCLAAPHQRAFIRRAAAAVAVAALVAGAAWASAKGIAALVASFSTTPEEEAMTKTETAIAAVAASLAASAANASTPSVAAALSSDGTQFEVTFSDHADATNSLWVVYGATDKGAGTNGWDHIERLGTVFPETSSWTYAAPSGWGENVKAIRFLLSEVPYDYDYSLDFIRNSTYNQRIALLDFDLYMNHRVCAKIKTVTYSDGNPAFFSNRATTGDANPKFTLFAIGGNSWRFDYNNTAGGNVKGVAMNADYSIEASSEGLYVNGSLVNTKKGTTSSEKSSGYLEFFCGNNTAGGMANMNLAFNLYGAQIYDAPTGGNLLVNLVPMVKGGVAGMYDTVRGKYYYSDTGKANFPLSVSTRIESENPFFASALVKIEEEGVPTTFTPGSATTDATDYTNANGGILDGTATLTLSGNNDWGGSFTFKNGTLVAGFGQGLGANDKLLIRPTSGLNGTTGGYGGWNGKATAAIGDGPGQISVANGAYIIYCAADGGELEVDIGGAGEAFSATSDIRRFLFNGAQGAGALTFKNDITTDVNNLTTVFRTGFGTATVAGNVTSGPSGTAAMTLACYGLDNAKVASDGKTLLAGEANSFKTMEIRSGNYGFAPGSKTVIGGNVYVHDGSLAAEDSEIKFSGEAEYVSQLQINAGAVSIKGGSFTAAMATVGTNHTTTIAVPSASLEIAGKFTLDASIAPSGKATGSMTINGSAASEALTIRDGAEIRMTNLNLLRRNVYMRGGTMTLAGNSGINNMGKEGYARCTLFGGRLSAPCAKQVSEADRIDSSVAEFVFSGGTLVTPSHTQTPFFQGGFTGGNSGVKVSVDGGTFEVSKSTEIPLPLLPYGSGSWNYATPEEWMTAPAFRKTGAATLTLSGGESTYKCATDVAAGTLTLASGDNKAVLPTAGVLRLTGGTLDLGGSEQTVKALLGTSGSVANGMLTVSDGIYPGGKGAVGSFTCGAALEGTLYCSPWQMEFVETNAQRGTVANVEMLPVPMLPISNFPPAHWELVLAIGNILALATFFMSSAAL